MVFKNFCDSYPAIKLGVLILLVTSAFILLHNNNASPHLVSSSSDSDKDVKPQARAKYCNLFSGDWVPTESGPMYTNETCSFIDDPRNCLSNGRSDTGYLYWRWSPYDCELPRFDPKRFLESMRNKVLGMIGDSISRNHVQSLLCMLSTVEKAVLIYHDESYHYKRWLVPTYNLTISFIWSPVLAKANLFQDANYNPTSDIELHLDLLDYSWTEQYTKFDYTIISTGAWFTLGAIYYENNTVVGCHFCPTRNLTELGIAPSHRKVIRNVYEHIIASNYTGTVIYRTTTPVHSDNADRTEGSTCKRTEPAKKGELELKQQEKDFHDTEIEEFERAKGKASEKGMNLRLLDVAYLLLLRPDGHPGLYSVKDGKGISDCLHWCVPGPIDYWNDLLMEMLM